MPAPAVYAVAMCGRYNLVTNAEALIDFFEIEENLVEHIEPDYNIPPSRDVAIVRDTAQGRQLSLARWGLVPHWSKEEKPGYSTINARAETVAEKPVYREPFRKRRCLIPATGFFEWKAGTDGKTPYHIHLPDNGLFAFAGLWDRWDREGEGFDSCSIIVTRANDTMQPIHQRMPVILPPALYNTWLDTHHYNRPQLESLLAPWGGQLETDPVTRYVNSPANNDPECLKPRAVGKR